MGDQYENTKAGYMDKQRIIALNVKKRAPVQPQSCSEARFTRILPEFRLFSPKM